MKNAHCVDQNRRFTGSFEFIFQPLIDTFCSIDIVTIRLEKEETSALARKKKTHVSLLSMLTIAKTTSACAASFSVKDRSECEPTIVLTPNFSVRSFALSGFLTIARNSYFDRAFGRVRSRGTTPPPMYPVVRVIVVNRWDS